MAGFFEIFFSSFVALLCFLFTEKMVLSSPDCVAYVLRLLDGWPLWLRESAGAGTSKGRRKPTVGLLRLMLFLHGICNGGAPRVTAVV